MCVCVFVVQLLVNVAEWCDSAVVAVQMDFDGTASKSDSFTPFPDRRSISNQTACSSASTSSFHFFFKDILYADLIDMSCSLYRLDLCYIILKIDTDR